MRRPVCGSGRLAPLDGGSSRRSGVMRLCSSEQPAHISLIRRRSRSIVSRASASSGIHPRSRAQYADVNIDREIEDAVTNRLTAGPSTSANRLVEQIERLAHHAFRGEVWAKASAYLREAGAKAFQRSVYREALACYEQSLDAINR